MHEKKKIMNTSWLTFCRCDTKPDFVPLFTWNWVESDNVSETNSNWCDDRTSRLSLYLPNTP